MTFIKLVRYQLVSMLSLRKFLIILTVFAINVWLVHVMYSDFIPLRFLDATEFMFLLPITITFDTMRLLLVLLPLLMMIGSFTEGQLKEHGYYLLLRVKSYQMWWPCSDHLSHYFL